MVLLDVMSVRRMWLEGGPVAGDSSPAGGEADFTFNKSFLFFVFPEIGHLSDKREAKSK